ncbi:MULTISPECIES: exonuclease SbcCD subunit D [unclassified Ligilactobacillus]|uniref:exonuclease SbcCD subunit D n=1 Tax=unclassified Ligilactobacillus TaxID=2767920 RepID=UPI003851CD8A
MRFLHTADWHIGKQLHGYSLAAEQADAFNQIEQLALYHHVDAVVVAGDIYDRGIASEKSVQLGNQMFARLNREDHLPLLVISGNHDSAPRLATGAPWYADQGFVLRTTLDECLTPVTLGDTQFFLLPFFGLQAARNFLDQPVRTMDEAVGQLVMRMQDNFNSAMRHVLVAHLFAGGSMRTESETPLEVGGLGPVSLSRLECFDYVALGHLHTHTALQHSRIKYSGTPLKFSVSEVHDQKGCWLVDTTAGTQEFLPLTPLHDVIVLRDKFTTLVGPAHPHLDPNTFVAVQLTDKGIIPDAMNQLRQFYPRIIEMTRVNGVTSASREIKGVKRMAPLDVLTAYYEDVAGEPLSTLQQEIATEILGKVEAMHDAP